MTGNSKAFIKMEMTHLVALWLPKLLINR